MSNSSDLERGQGPRTHSAFNATPEEIKEIQKLHLILRVCYMLTSIMMAVAAVLAISGATLATTFIALYVFFFALLIFCFEFGLKVVSTIIASNFGFMYTLLGRVILVLVICGMVTRLGIYGYVSMVRMKIFS